jgi:phenylpyruvate tautomerase PptA (4-oxalocrotonate tautomerase family)
MDKKAILMAIASKDDIEHITDAIMKFVNKTSAEVGVDVEDVATSSLVALLLYYVKQSSDDKAVAVGNLMSLLSSVFIITSTSTNWVEVNDIPSGGIN